jgi:acetyl esterase/lipase
MQSSAQNNDLYGVTIHRYDTKVISMPEQETHVTLIDTTLGCAKELYLVTEYVTRFIKNETKLAIIVEYEQHVTNLIQKLIVLKNNIVQITKITNNTDHSDRPVNPYPDHVDLTNVPNEYRGMLFTMIYNLSDDISKIKKKTIGLNLSKLMRKVIVYDVVTEYANMLADDRLKNNPINPFSENIDMENDPKIKTLKYHDFIENLGQQYRYKFRLFYNMMVKVTAAHKMATTASNNYFVKKCVFGMTNFYYMFDHKKATSRALEFFETVTPNKGKELWNMQDDPMFKPFLVSTFYYVRHSFKFRIPINKRILILGDQINNELVIDESAGELVINESAGELVIDESAGELVDERLIIDYSSSEETDEASTNETITDNCGVHMSKFNHYNSMIKSQLGDYKKDNIALRFIYNGKNISEFNFGKRKYDYSTLQNVTDLFKKDSKARGHNGNIIFHIHGGGFVAMSTRGHENYLREWTRETGIPIISCEYTLAPEEKYPVQTEECYYAYKWVVQNADKILGQKLNKIFIAGDSAGGNLALSVMNRIIANKGQMNRGDRVPDGAIITYPVTNVSSQPSPARLLCLLDPLVNLAFMKMCALNYPREDSHKEHDPFLSPIRTPGEILKHYPPVFITVGTLDPLFDDGVNMAKRIGKYNNNQVKLDIWDGLAHGFLNIVDISAEAKQVHTNISKWILGMSGF